MAFCTVVAATLPVGVKATLEAGPFTASFSVSNSARAAWTVVDEMLPVGVTATLEAGPPIDSFSLSISASAACTVVDAIAPVGVTATLDAKIAVSPALVSCPWLLTVKDATFDADPYVPPVTAVLVIAT